MAVLNPNSGVGAVPNANLVQAVRDVRTAGVQVIGYVHTDYGRRATDEVVAEIERYSEWYGVDGIFLDEASTTCTDEAYYASLNASVKRTRSDAMTVLNPGTQTMECFMSVADVVITFEGNYDSYIADYVSPKWVASYPSGRFWHLVYGASTSVQMRGAVALSKSRRAGWIYVTPEELPNPWGTLPGEGYWSEQLRAARGAAKA